MKFGNFVLTIDEWTNRSLYPCVCTSVGRCQKYVSRLLSTKNITTMTIVASACTIQHTIGDMNLQHFFCFMYMQSAHCGKSATHV